jgi:ABC-type phosphate transport system substrate-binding protein
VIVNLSNPINSTTREFVAQVFFKRITRWQGGDVVHPVDLRAESNVRRAFSGGVLKRSVAAVRSYWQQRIFSGRDLPPPELDSDEAVIKYVSSSPGAIGYVSPGAKLGRAKELVVR